MQKRDLLLQRMKKIRDKMQERAEWPHKYTNVENEELENRVKKVTLVSVCEMECSGKWPTRQMGGMEVQLARKLKKVLIAAQEVEERVGISERKSSSSERSFTSERSFSRERRSENTDEELENFTDIAL
jgi:hypothetical protein